LAEWWELFIDAIRENKANIAMSALLTTTVMEQKNVIEGLSREGIRSKLMVIIGGSLINQEFADSIGRWSGSTALERVAIARSLLGRA
jgi:5-methyltetrahydrofolate--homocysteine methyltransferase